MAFRYDTPAPRFAVCHVLLPDAIVAARRNQQWCDVLGHLPLAASAYERCLFRDRAAQVHINAMIEYVAAPSAAAASSDAKKMLPSLYDSVGAAEWHSNMMGLCMRQGLVADVDRESLLTQCNWTPEMMVQMRRYRAAVRSASRLG